MRDNIKPGDKWEFNEDVAACFANMLERSIPDYKSMRALTYKIGEQYIRPDTLIVDVGCSTGLAVEPFVKKYRDQNDFLLIDNAPAMVDACKKRFIGEPGVSVENGNLWEYLPLQDPVSLVLSVLSLQFMPTSYRQQMIFDIYKSLVPGGALILVEKIVSENLDDLMVQMYYEMKRENGYTQAQIMEKRRSLENVLSPLKPEWNVDMLRTAGFCEIGMFWRCLNFCGWIAVK
jgi:tRNA (cmo5U34)-methyltransferase